MEVAKKDISSKGVTIYFGQDRMTENNICDWLWLVCWESLTDSKVLGLCLAVAYISTSI